MENSTNTQSYENSTNTTIIENAVNEEDEQAPHKKQQEKERQPAPHSKAEETPNPYKPASPTIEPTSATEPRKNLYQIVIDDLMEKINTNQFHFETPICTEKQLMEDYHISRITAKRAIMELEYQGILYRKRGVGSFVARDIFERNHFVRKSSRILPLVIPFSISNKYLMDMIQQINLKINPFNCFLSIFIAGQSSAKEQAILSQLLEQDVSGLIYFPCSMDFHLDLLNQFVLRDLPVILLDLSTTVPYLHSVLCDNAAGERLLTNHLISLGHTRIAYLSEVGISRLSSIYERFSGYLSAMRQADLVVEPSFVVPEIRGADSHEAFLYQVQRLHACGVTAIECENDGVARSVIECCRELSIRVPEDISVCGFDANDSEITSVYQNELEMAEQIGDIFLEASEHNPMEGKRVVVPVKLELGSSTGPCRNAADSL